MRTTTLIASILIFFSSSIALACPRKGPLTDYNCDQTLKVAVIGDSLVFGIGDTQNGNKGGYVKRVGKRLKNIEFVNLGVPGLHASKLVAELSGRNETAWSSKVWREVADADVVILDVGRNDRWKLGLPKDTFDDIKRSARLIQRRVKSETDVQPWVTIAALMIPNRGAQAPWVAELNQFIINDSKGLELRFDTVSKRLLSEDRIHPTPDGYQSMAEVFRAFLVGPLERRLKKDRKDADRDGLYDLFETLKFGTDPATADSDADGVLDGADVFGS